jgi:hypothetical protein
VTAEALIQNQQMTVNMTDYCRRLKSMTAVMMLMRQVYFSTYNIVSVLLSMVTPTTVKKIQKSIYCAPCIQ